MAHTRTNHPLSLYDANKSKPETAIDRLVVLSWKGNTKTGRVAHATRCFSLPSWTPQLSGDDRDYVEILIEAVFQRQKATAHKYVTEILDEAGICNDIPASLLEPSAILTAFLDEENEDTSRGKLSGEQIAAWYEDKLAPLVSYTISEKQGWLVDGYQMTKEQEKTVMQASNGYRATLARLAAPQPKVEITLAKQLQFALGLLGTKECETDIVARKLGRKLEAIINPPAESLITLASLM
jgi:hypothetical protein